MKLKEERASIRRAPRRAIVSDVQQTCSRWPTVGAVSVTVGTAASLEQIVLLEKHPLKETFGGKVLMYSTGFSPQKRIGK